MNGIVCLCSIRNLEIMYLQGHFCPKERFWGVGVDVNEVILLQILSIDPCHIGLFPQEIYVKI